MAPLIQFAPLTTSVTPSANQALIDLATVKMGDTARSMLTDAVQELGKQTVEYCRGTHPSQIEQAKAEAEKAAEIQKKQEDLRRLAEEYIEGLRQQASTGQIINKDSLKMVEHIAHLLKDDSITLGLQTDLMEHGVEYNPKASKKTKVKTEVVEPIQLKPEDKEEAA